MKGIGGNTQAIIQMKRFTKDENGKYVRNGTGEIVMHWQDVQTIKKGWLDLSGGDSRYTTYNAKIQESTHCFICDYVKLDERITAENSRMMVNGKQYDIVLIDNPMELNAQLEFYLRYVGGQ